MPSQRLAVLLTLAITLWTSLGLSGLVYATGEVESDFGWEFNDTVFQFDDELICVAENIVQDNAVTPAQALAPQFSLNARRRAPNSRPAASSNAGTATLAGLASVPYMIGDTGAGSCLGFQGLVPAQLSHPTLACARLNIAEANSPLPTDRFYYSYRHFANASTISAYQFAESVDIDRHLLAWEHVFWDDMASLELRLPIELRMRSDIFSIIAPAFGVVDPLVGPNGGRRTELGNIAAIFKYLLIERDWAALSAGLGITLPTAQDVDYRLAVDGEIEFPGFPGLTADEAAAFQGIFANETIYLEPFLAWLMKEPTSPWFHQGFLQFEVAANPSRVTFDGDGATLFLQSGVPIGFYDFFTPVPQRVELFSQTLMRLNLGTGYLFVDRPQARGLRQLASLFELHYTTTLTDAILSEVPLTTQSSVGTVPLQTITVGNGMNRVDILNAATGISMNYAGWIVTNGVAVPLRDESNRGFDFEYNFQLQRPF
ncbi:MAG: hypothetical protein SH868_14230 [Bythopirellula sp.]|nr:hypothetical protein [Bythopirellula sp.]